MASGPKTFTIPEHLEGSRLDKAAVELVTGSSRARIRKAIEDGEVRLNGRVRTKGTVVAAGDTLSVEVHDEGGAPVPEPNAPLDVRFENGAVIVVAKAAGQPTAPLKQNETGTLANALIGAFPELSGVGYSPREPGLVHRLDTDTSGLVVVARTLDAFAELVAALKDETLEKNYLLICSADGLAETGTIEHPLANHPKDQRRVYACVHPRDVARYAPRPAITHFRMRERVGPWALVEVRVAKALRHQIRVHFASIGHPLLGDTLYGGPKVEGLERHALHASRVAYGGGPAVPKFDVGAPLPLDMARVLAK